MLHVTGAYNEVKLFCDFLPAEEVSPAYTYSNMMLNLCACTWPHRGKSNRGWCTTFTLGDCEGAWFLILHLVI